MRMLIIGGTGTISSAVTALAVSRGMEVYVFNRGERLGSGDHPVFPDGLPGQIQVIRGDIRDEVRADELLGNLTFDAAADFIAFDAPDLERDYRLFRARTSQFLYISSASAYQTPPADPVITESTPLFNPLWEYSRRKIAGEDYLMRRYREDGFPVTIVRPSHTYSDRSMPVALHGRKGSWQVLQRMLDGKEVIIPGDGTSLWTLTHSEDFARAFLGLIGNPRAIGNAFHITSDESLTWNQIYHCIGRALGVPVHAVHIPSDALAKANPEYQGTLLGDKSNSVLFDNSKIKRIVPGFTASIPFAEGARRAARFLLAHPSLQVPDPEFDAFTDQVLGSYHAFLDSL